jgi:hypothetical protein
MEQVMEVCMMEIEDVLETLCVVVTTANSLVLTTMRKMTAVSSHLHPQQVKINIYKSKQKKTMIGQRCKGRNYGGRRCCTPQNPCIEGEGDCDGAGDGAGDEHDGDRGCLGTLVCGSNNCKQFGAYYHEKDDCCEQPSNWGAWGAWSSCNGVNRAREKECKVSECYVNGRPGTVITQQEPCSGKK